MSKKSSSLEDTKEAKRSISCDKTTKATKVAKVNDVASGETETNKINKAALSKELAALAASIASLNDLMATTTEDHIKELIPSALVNKCEAAHKNLDSNRCLIEWTLENGMGDAASILKDSKDSKTEAVTCAKVMKAQLVVAMSLAANNVD